jgi:hypothetical protein
MQTSIEIEDIEEMRRAAGIDDVELRRDIRGLRAGDNVKLTLSAGPHSRFGIPRQTGEWPSLQGSVQLAHWIPRRIYGEPHSFPAEKRAAGRGVILPARESLGASQIPRQARQSSHSRQGRTSHGI